MNPFLRQTHREKLATVDGINLFFGALLGANLGSLDGLALGDYVKVIILLAGTVMALRNVSSSERRAYAYVTMALWAAIVASSLFVPSFRPQGLPWRDVQRLAATIAVWIAAVLVIELSPTGKAPDESH
ncbi:hypothetical protein [Sphingomonas crusticola]|uniref:hypothetical protein n=1 Tax=Sphingomonas crusticola TaxID=1697973 RepID=UPI0013C2D0CE|nr:hypothetical protein [Sphingomonas crusticola]